MAPRKLSGRGLSYWTDGKGDERIIFVTIGYRLVVLNAIGAAERGAGILTRTECVSLRRRDGLWHAVLRPAGGGAERQVVARAVANAAGPWVDKVLTGAAGLRTVMSGSRCRRAPSLLRAPCRRPATRHLSP